MSYSCGCLETTMIKPKEQVPNQFHLDLLLEFIKQPDADEAWCAFTREELAKGLLHEQTPPTPDDD